MRFMMLLKANDQTEAGVMPTLELIDAMGRYNEQMVKAGVLLDGAGLQASSRGARVLLDGAKRTVVDGPFGHARELVAGFWMIQVKSKDEAIEWARRCPSDPVGGPGEIELRQVFEVTDFDPETIPAGLTDTEMEQRYGVKPGSQPA